ncbi:hypothetical protein AN639_03430 [Candidatus Epulonipiscium fishelsonii]|nr:hypothetical protein AN639_03430 [Epulopiscium sp. SCG-B05WGA-EpuloA1]
MFHEYSACEKNNLGVVVTLKANGDIDKTIVGSVVESLVLNSAEKSSWDKLKQIFSAPSLQMASFTITEKGYSLQDAQGEYFASVENDFKNGPEAPVSYIGKVASLLYTRYLANKAPIAMVSMDNCSHNGDKLFNAVEAYAKAWEKNGLVEKGFYDYITDKDTVSFPWSMIDKITPRPDEKVRVMLQKSGFDDVETIITSKNTFVAPFVNAEEAQYLVIEDWFPNGRSNLEEAGIIFTDRETVDKEFDLEAIGVSLELHKEIMKDETIREVLMPEYSSIGYSYNISSYPTDIPEIRKAMSYAVDKEVIAPISEPGMVAGDMYSLGLPPSLTSNYVDETFLDTLEKYTYDIDTATELMESIGWTKDGNMWVDQNGESPEIVIGTIGEWTATLVTGEAISEMLKDFGFNVTFKPMEVVTFYEFANSGETNLAVDFYPSSVSIQHPYEAYNSLWGVAPRMGIDLPGYGEKFEFVNPESGETFDWGEKTELLFNANTHEETTELVKEFMQFSNDMVLSMPITEKFIVTRIHNPKLVLAEVEMGTPVLDYYWTQGKNYHLAKMLRDGKLYFISSFHYTYVKYRE